MINVETVDLSARNFQLPADRVGMVIAQPFLSLTDVEPYRCTAASTPNQLKVLTRTLDIAREAPHGAGQTHFTIFPEYSIPGLTGIGLVQAAVEDAQWPTGTIVIGGVDALSKQDFSTVAASARTYLDAVGNDLGRIAANEWINCGITWVKGADGTVERWLQPKLSPAWPEQNVLYQDMFRGNSVFAFKGTLNNGTQYRFCSLVCFDWIATIDGQKAWRSVVDSLGHQAAQIQAELSLSWCFVIQSNPKPSFDTVLTEAARFFDQTAVPNVHRDKACLVFANTAGKTGPGRSDRFGATSLILAKQTLFADPDCHSTFCNGGERFRLSTLLAAQRDILFRERGACVHSFAQVNPGSLSAGAAGKTIALQNPFVFSLNDDVDPRAPSAPVPASTKWLNDELDEVRSLGVAYAASSLAAEANAAHVQTVAGLRGVTPQSATHVVALATHGSRATNADNWDRLEAEALQHVVDTLNILGLSFQPATVGADPAHMTIQINGCTVDVLAIRGVTHECCAEHSRAFSPLPRRQVLLISRDQDNNAYHKRLDGNFLRLETIRLGEERKITDPVGGVLHLGYRQLLDIFRQADTLNAAQTAINAQLAA